MSDVVNEDTLKFDRNSLGLFGEMDVDSTPEPELEFEAWMINDKMWMKQFEINLVDRIEDVSEELLAIEQWMTDDELWRF
ncbi:MAG: hypothetical protein ACERKD_18115 [Prolixibacteraceae bacterium]